MRSGKNQSTGMITGRRNKKRRIPRRDDTAHPPRVSGDIELLNRELSWLEFNFRVLSEAQSESTPLLERVRFLTIVTSNLDEFFMNRVGSLKQRLSSGWFPVSSDGMTVRQQLDQIRHKVLELQAAQSECYRNSIRPALVTAGISVLSWSELSEDERRQAVRYFQLNVFPILTPQAVDPGHPFPFISNLSLSLGVLLKHPDRDEQLFARVKVPPMLPQLLRLDGTAPDIFRFVSLSTVIEHNLGLLFPGMIVQDVLTFRVTRNGALDIDDYEVTDLVEVLEEELRERKFAKVVRLEFEPNPEPVLVRFLVEEMELSDPDLYESIVDIEVAALREIADLNIPKFRYEPWSPTMPTAWADEDANIFSLLRTSDLLVHHPYESFSGSVERFLRSAVDDPKVLAIKLTLYRAGEKSPLIPLLARAAENEKNVVCLIEVKASFDEARNLRLAETLEASGVHVMYGVVGLKTHAKVMMIVRQEPDGIRCYTHLGTGNYNFQTARIYTDFGLFSSHPEVNEDVVDLFHYLTGRSLKRDYKKLLVAPHGMKDRVLQLITREIEHVAAGKPGHIILKVNALEESAICQALNRAAQAGVRVDLLVRGICCLRPSADPSVNLQVLSLVGRFLEHSRVWYFRNGSDDPVDGDMYLSSADLMHRNLHRRVEVAVPLLDRAVRERCWEVLQVTLVDRHSWKLTPSGSYERLSAAPDIMGAQQTLMKLFRERSSQALAS
jgi:polyphosphate kinase